MSAKIDHDTISDSVVVASFQNIVPVDYDRPTSSTSNISDADLVAQVELTVLTSLSKWDVHDGINCRHFWVLDDTRNTQEHIYR